MFDNIFDYYWGSSWLLVLHNTEKELLQEGESVFQTEGPCKYIIHEKSPASETEDKRELNSQQDAK